MLGLSGKARRKRYGPGVALVVYNPFYIFQLLRARGDSGCVNDVCACTDVFFVSEVVVSSVFYILIYV